MNVTITGIPALRKRLQSKKAVGQLAAALYTEGHRIMTDSKQNYVPVDQGTLRASGHVKQPHITGPRCTVTLGFGGAAAAYALIQHERLDYAHTVGTSKYLETPTKNAARGLGVRIGNQLDLF